MLALTRKKNLVLFPRKNLKVSIFKAMRKVFANKCRIIASGKDCENQRGTNEALKRWLFFTKYLNILIMKITSALEKNFFTQL